MNTIWIPDLSRHDGPKYRALIEALRADIADGVLAAGTRLPTVRDLAWRLSVTPGTVARAYQAATQDGLLQATVGRGTFVADALPGAVDPVEEALYTGVPDAQMLDFRSPCLPEVGQTAAIAAALRRMAGDSRLNWVDYTSQEDEEALRGAVVTWLGGRRLGAFGPADLVLVHGGQSAIRMVLDSCLTGERPVVLTEALAYPGFRYAARLARAEVVGLALDAEGVRPDALEAACRRHHPQVLCLTPQVQNPTVAVMGPERRLAIVSIARHYNVQIIEDECYAVPGNGVATLRDLAPERVWYIGSLSKQMSAALRFGYVVCPVGRGAAARMAARHSYFALPLPMSALVLDLLRSGQADAVRAAITAEMTRRVELMVRYLGGYDLTWVAGVPFVWLRLPQGWRASTFTRMAEEAGILMRSADQYALIHDQVPHAVRLAVPGQVSLSDLDSGLATLARMLEHPPSDMAV